MGLVASDGDYTLLAQRIKECGLTVLGYGEGRTPVTLKKLMPKFKVKRYGCKTLGKLYERLEKYELVKTGKGIAGLVRIKS